MKVIVTKTCQSSKSTKTNLNIISMNLAIFLNSRCNTDNIALVLVLLFYSKSYIKKVIVIFHKYTGLEWEWVNNELCGVIFCYQKHFSECLKCQYVWGHCILIIPLQPAVRGHEVLGKTNRYLAQHWSETSAAEDLCWAQRSRVCFVKRAVSFQANAVTASSVKTEMVFYDCCCECWPHFSMYYHKRFQSAIHVM